jgi:hypothetical protein
VEAGTIQGIARIKSTVEAVIAEAVAWDVNTAIVIRTGVLGAELSIIACKRCWNE